jgi:hypothetical protein
MFEHATHCPICDETLFGNETCVSVDCNLIWDNLGDSQMSQMKKIEVQGVEEWREYDFEGRCYRIDNPVRVEFREGSATHRVTDSVGIVHCVPAPGQQGCVLRWKGAVIA